MPAKKAQDQPAKPAESKPTDSQKPTTPAANSANASSNSTKDVTEQFAKASISGATDNSQRTLIFKIHYLTTFGQNVSIMGDLPQLGRFEVTKAAKMHGYVDGFWDYELKVDSSVQSINYKYAVVSSDDVLKIESGPNRHVNIDHIKGGSVVVLQDFWKFHGSPDTTMYAQSSAMTDVIFGRQQKDAAPLEPVQALNVVSHSDDKITVRFAINALIVPPDCSVRVVGSSAALGNWKSEDAPVLANSEFPIWKVAVEIPRADLPITYKYAVCEKSGKARVWEDGENHFANADKRVDVLHIVDVPMRAKYDWRGAGVAVPIFALRSESGMGVGEFFDLKLLADWANASGLRIVQILPINDTSVTNTWKDSYPYSSLSVYALHPMYLHLPKMTTTKAILDEVDAARTSLNKLKFIDYEEVMNTKIRLLGKIFAEKKQIYTKPGTDKDYDAWFKENAHWLPAYALFSALKNKYKTADYAQWKEVGHPTADDLTRLTGPSSPLFEEVAYHCFVQYNLHLQLQEACQYCVSRGVALKGDIAIGVNAKSCDTWVWPSIFRLDESTGAPPDAFSDDGQLWGFPTYDWDAMAKDNYSWWRSRLTHMSQYFQAIRIDHILGFFRIFEMHRASSSTGLLGHFFPSLPIKKSELEPDLWDVERLTEPYVRWHIVRNLFGYEAEHVASTFFNEKRYGVLAFKPEYDTEIKICQAFPIESTKERYFDDNHLAYNRRMRSGLLKLVQNVCLLRSAENADEFFPRIMVYKTSSFQDLPYHEQSRVMALHNDYFFKRQDPLWAAAAFQRLPVIINASKMLICGEDLGMVPDCVAPVLDALGILGLRIQRMPSDLTQEFQHCSSYPYLTVCTPSVHDTSTLRGWWEEDKAVTQRFYNQVLHKAGAAPDFCNYSLSQEILKQHLDSQSMLAIFALQDIFGLKPEYYQNINPKEERINEPSNPEHYWRYRIHVPLEKLVADKQFSTEVRTLIASSGRLNA